MEETSLINEAHFLERKSEEAARRGHFDEAIRCCVAAADCLTRLLHPAQAPLSPALRASVSEALPGSAVAASVTRSTPASPTASSSTASASTALGQARDSILAQLAFLEQRQKRWTRRKAQFEFLGQVLAAQRRQQLCQAESPPPPPEPRPRRGSTVRRRSSVKNGATTAAENRRRSGGVDAPPPPKAAEEEMRMEGRVKEGEERQEARWRLSHLGEGTDSRGKASTERYIGEQVKEKLDWWPKEGGRGPRLRHPGTLSESTAWEASLYEMSMNPSRKEREATEAARSGRGGGGGGPPSRYEEKAEGNPEKWMSGWPFGERMTQERTCFSPSEDPRHILRVDLPPLDPPPVTVPSLSPRNAVLPWTIDHQ